MYTLNFASSRVSFLSGILALWVVFAQLSVLFPDSREMFGDLEDQVGLSLSSSGGCSTLLSWSLCPGIGDVGSIIHSTCIYWAPTMCQTPLWLLGYRPEQKGIFTLIQKSRTGNTERSNCIACQMVISGEENKKPETDSGEDVNDSFREVIRESLTKKVRLSQHLKEIRKASQVPPGGNEFPGWIQSMIKV